MIGPVTQNDVHVWYCFCDDPQVEARQQADLQLLTDDEVARYHRFAFEKDRRLFVVARSLLRTTLSRYAAVRPEDWRFEQTLNGKPFLPADIKLPALSFNVSHSGRMAACAVTLNHPIGVDVETTTRDTNPKVARYFMAPDELERYDAAVGDEKCDLFYRYWTLKESYAKALGLGLSLRLTEYAFLLDDQSPPKIVRAADGDPAAMKNWHFHQERIAPHYYLAVAVDTAGAKRPAISVAKVRL